MQFRNQPGWFHTVSCLLIFVFWKTLHKNTPCRLTLHGVISCYKIIFFGHFSAQIPQPVHFSWSMYAILSTTWIASDGQFFSQRWQPIHPTEHALMTSLPLSLELHCTRCIASYGTSSIKCFGHAATHFPQALQTFGSTFAIPSTTWIASNGHAFTQFPNPRNP